MAFDFKDAKYVFDDKGKLYLYVHDKGGKNQHVYISLEGEDKGGAYVAADDNFKDGLKPIKAFKADSDYDVGNASEKAVKVDLADPGKGKNIKAGGIELEKLREIVRKLGFFTYAQMEVVSYINDQKEVCSASEEDFGYKVDDCTLLKKGDDYYIRYRSTEKNSIRQSKYKPGKKLKDEEKITNESRYIYHKTGVFVNAEQDSYDDWDSTPNSDEANLSQAIGFKEIFLNTGKLFFDLLDVIKPVKNDKNEDVYLLRKRGTADLFFYKDSDGSLAKCTVDDPKKIEDAAQAKISVDAKKYVNEKGELVDASKNLKDSYFGKRFVNGGLLKDKTKEDEILDFNLDIGKPGLIIGSGAPIDKRKGIHLTNISGDHYFFDLEDGFLIKCKGEPAKGDNKVEANDNKVLDKAAKKFKKLDITNANAKGCEQLDELKNLVSVKKAYFDLGLEAGDPLLVDGDGAIANKRGIYLKDKNDTHYFYDLEKGGLIKCDGAPVNKKITCSDLANKVLNPDNCKFELGNLDDVDENKAKKISEEIGFIDPALCITLKQNRALFKVVTNLEFNNPCVKNINYAYFGFTSGSEKYLSFKGNYYYGLDNGELLIGDYLKNSAFDKNIGEFVEKIKLANPVALVSALKLDLGDENKKIEEIAVLKDFLDSTGALIFGKFEIQKHKVKVGEAETQSATIKCSDGSLDDLKGKEGVHLKLGTQNYFYFKEKDVFIKCDAPTDGKVKIDNLVGKVLKNDANHVDALDDPDAAKTSNFKFLKEFVKEEAAKIVDDKNKDEIVIGSKEDVVSYVKPTNGKSFYFIVKYTTKGDKTEKQIYVQADNGKLFNKLDADHNLSEPMKISFINPGDSSCGFKLEKDSTGDFAVKSSGDDNVKFLYSRIKQSGDFKKHENFYMEIDGDSEEKEISNQKCYVVKFKTLLGGEGKIAYFESSGNLHCLNEAGDSLNGEIKNEHVQNMVKSKLIAEGKIVSGLEVIDNGGNAFENLKIGSSAKTAVKGYKVKLVDPSSKDVKYLYLAAETKDDFGLGKFYEMSNDGKALIDDGSGKPKAGKIDNSDNVFSGSGKTLEYIYSIVESKKEFKVEIEIATGDTPVKANNMTKNLKKVTLKVGGIDKTDVGNELYFDHKTAEFFNKDLSKCKINGGEVVEIKSGAIFLIKDLKKFCSSIKYGEENKSIDDFINLFENPHSLIVNPLNQDKFPKKVEIYCGQNKFDLEVDKYGRLLDKDNNNKFVRFENGKFLEADDKTATNVRTYNLDDKLDLIDKIEFISDSVKRGDDAETVKAEMIDIWGNKKTITIRKDTESNKLKFVIANSMSIKDGKFISESGDCLSETTKVFGGENLTLEVALKNAINASNDKDELNKILGFDETQNQDKFELMNFDISKDENGDVIKDECLGIVFEYKKKAKKDTKTLWVDKEKNIYEDLLNGPQKNGSKLKIIFDENNGFQFDSEKGDGILDFIKNKFGVQEDDERYKKIRDFSGVVAAKKISFKDSSIVFEEEHPGFAKVGLFVGDDENPKAYIYVSCPRYELYKTPDKKDENKILGGKDAIKLGNNGEIEFANSGDPTDLRLDKNEYIPDFLVGLKGTLEKKVFKPEFKYDLAEELTSEKLKEMAKNDERVKISVSTTVVGLKFEGDFYVDKKGIAYRSQEKNNKEMIQTPLLSDNGFSEYILFNTTSKEIEALKANSIGLNEKLKDFLNPETQNVLKTELVEAGVNDKKKYVILKVWIENSKEQKIEGSEKEFYIFKKGDKDFILRDKSNLEEGNEIYKLSVSKDGNGIDVVNVDENNKGHYIFSEGILSHEFLKCLEEQKTQETKTETEPPITQVYEPKNLKSKFEVNSVKAGKSKIGENENVDCFVFKIKDANKKIVEVFWRDDDDVFVLYNKEGKKVKLDETSGNVLELKEGEENSGQYNKLSNFELLIEALLRNNIVPKSISAKIELIEEKKIKDDSVKIVRQEGGKEDVQLEVIRRIAKIKDKNNKDIYFDLFTLNKTDETGKFTGGRISNEEIGKRLVSFGEGDKTVVYDISVFSIAEKMNTVHKILLGKKSNYEELLKLDADAGLKILESIYSPDEAKKIVDGFERFVRDYGLFDEKGKLNIDKARELFGEKLYIRTATGYISVSIGALSGVSAGTLAALVFSGIVVFPFAPITIISSLIALGGVSATGWIIFIAEAISTKINRDKYMAKKNLNSIKGVEKKGRSILSKIKKQPKNSEEKKEGKGKPFKT